MNPKDLNSAFLISLL